MPRQAKSWTILDYRRYLTAPERSKGGINSPFHVQCDAIFRRSIKTHFLISWFAIMERSDLDVNHGYVDPSTHPRRPIIACAEINISVCPTRDCLGLIGSRLPVLQGVKRLHSLILEFGIQQS